MSLEVFLLFVFNFNSQLGIRQSKKLQNPETGAMVFVLSKKLSSRRLQYAQNSFQAASAVCLIKMQRIKSMTADWNVR